jgi:transposase
MCSFVRELTQAEGLQLSRILKSSTNAVMLRRAQVVAFSGQGMQAKHIAKQLCLHEEYVRELIRRFDAGSFEALKPKPRTGRPRELEPEEVAQVVEIATMRPKDFGLPLTTWSLRKLADFLVGRRMVSKITANMIGRILRENGVTFQRTKTWKESNDPEFVPKKNGSPSSTRKRRPDRR